jgi:hypothetical protein
MDLTPEDRERLDRLMEQHLNGQLSDEEYQRKSWEILKRTDTGASSKSTFRARSGTLRTAPSASQLDLQALESRTIRRQGRLKKTLIPLVLVFGFGIVIALLIGVLSSVSSPQGVPVPGNSTTTETGDPVQIEPEQNDGALFFKPGFGAEAEQHCRIMCTASNEGTGREACLRDCARFRLSKFGRRITLEPLDAKSDARQWARSCVSDPIALRPHSSAVGWEEDIEAAAYVLSRATRLSSTTSEGTVQTLYDRLLQSARHLRAPPGGGERETALSEGMLRVSCLRSGAVLAALGQAFADKRSDSFSAQYYQQFRNEMDAQASPREASVLQQAAGMGLFAYE